MHQRLMCLMLTTRCTMSELFGSTLLRYRVGRPLGHWDSMSYPHVRRPTAAATSATPQQHRAAPQALPHSRRPTGRRRERLGRACDDAVRASRGASAGGRNRGAVLCRRRTGAADAVRGAGHRAQGVHAAAAVRGCSRRRGTALWDHVLHVARAAAGARSAQHAPGCAGSGGMCSAVPASRGGRRRW